MALAIETFSNAKGGNAFFKAIGHPLAAEKVPGLLTRLAGRRVALYDPLGYAAAFAAIHPLESLTLCGVFVQDLEDLGRSLLGRRSQPVTDLPGSGAEVVLVTAFDAGRLVDHARHLLPPGAEVVTLDELRLPEAMLSQPRAYLSPLNFATNFVFFRDEAGQHTRLVTANYWSGYAPCRPRAWCRLFDSAGRVLAEWEEDLPPAGASFAIDSAAVRARFGLPAFTGQLFLHVMNVAGHDVVKYALDTYGDTPEVLSCTHDANSWPADFYAGLPAPEAGERVVLWLQNSHPRPIPAGEIGLNRMGSGETRRLMEEIPPFATRALAVEELFPELRWPAQLEIEAGKWMVRPRYEVVTAKGRRRIAHVNVERTDLKPDPRLPELSNLLGKGFLLPAPILPKARFDSLCLPTPMARAQTELPVALLVYDDRGQEVARRALGRLPRDHAVALEAGEILNGRAPWGHMELVYDFAAGGEGDGWLHALFRYRDRESGHAAETSFGAHVFNTLLTYKGEPQSYAGRAPGLSTRLFLRLAPDLAAGRADAFCHLIYPASTPWHAESATDLILVDDQGREVARRRVAIACGGSLHFRVKETFEAAALAEAGPRGYVLIRDVTCRLFGYHGLVAEGASFSLDHMFGF